MKNVNEVSKLTGVSRRTLQYYDDEEIVKTERSNNNYRLYDERSFGNAITQNAQNFSHSDSQKRSKADQLRELKDLLDEGILTQEEFDVEKKRILNK